MATKTIYIYKDNSKEFYYKIGYADIRIGFNPETTSAMEIAEKRIHEQRSAAVNSDFSIVYVFDISDINISSKEVESYIHDKFKLYRKKINKNLRKGEKELRNTEWFVLEKFSDIDVIEFVNRCIKAKTSVNAKVKYKLRSYQEYLKQKFLLNYNSGYDTFTLELAPRFGKTLFILDLFADLVENHGFNYLILPTYILSTNTSFKNEIRKYQQFDEFIFVDDKDKDFLSKIKNNDKVIIGLSLHLTEEKHKEYVDAINELCRGKKLLVIDEADQGTCTLESQDKVNQINSDIYIDMSGTGLCKILNSKHKNGEPCHLSFSYTEMLLAKHKRHPDVEWSPELEKIPDPYMYRLVVPDGNWKNSLMHKLGLDVSWSKILGNVNANKSILQDLLEALFIKNQRNQFDADKSILTKLSLDDREEFNRCDVCMIFANFKNNKQFNDFIKVANSCLRNKYEVMKINSEATSNAEAEDKVRDKISLMKHKADGKRLLIVSKNMASRSFSIPEIDTVFLMYDRGGEGQTSQKFSRANTSGNLFDGTVKKRSSLVSLSFDSSRKEYNVFDEYIFKEVIKIQDHDESLQDAIKRLYHCWNIFHQDEEGEYFKLDYDEYAKSLLTSTKTKSIFKSLVDIKHLTSIIQANDILGYIPKTKSVLRKNDIDISKVKTIKKLHDYIKNVDTTNFSAKEYEEHLNFLISNIEELSAFNNFKSNNIHKILEEIIEDKDSDRLVLQIENYFKVKFSFIIKAVCAPGFPSSIANTIIEYKNKNFRKFNW